MKWNLYCCVYKLILANWLFDFREAKDKKKRIWKEYTPSSSSIDIKDKAFQGKVNIWSFIVFYTQIYSRSSVILDCFRGISYILFIHAWIFISIFIWQLLGFAYCLLDLFIQPQIKFWDRIIVRCHHLLLCRPKTHWFLDNIFSLHGWISLKFN